MQIHLFTKDHNEMGKKQTDPNVLKMLRIMENAAVVTETPFLSFLMLILSLI